MLACLLNRRKMVDYFEGALTPAQELKVRRHLDACATCRKVFSDSGAVIRLAASKIPPRPDAAFWKDFDASLSRKLDELAVSREAGVRRPVFHVGLRPALALMSVAVVVVALGIRVLPLTRFHQPIDEAQLVDEAVLLDEMSPNGDNRNTSTDDMIEDAALLIDVGSNHD